ncbi:MAG: 2,3,4,5-tetrahydropyridine-2,6-dicarboxylate N-succinyltransferase, partial [Bacteroidales bacterium]|nr:2,3,4,5-tetrahydropyridine-2,6-dicarboxylate N-succinyltransferase [Bacteroidales bacterium]
MEDVKRNIELAWNDRKKLNDRNTIESIDFVIDQLDKGKIRVA